MKYVLPIAPQPAPVMPAHIDLDVRYVVVRGDGQCRVFDTLYANSVSSWKLLAQQSMDFNTILVPLDMFTAVRLGLVTFEELELPEALRATISMIK